MQSPLLPCSIAAALAGWLVVGLPLGCVRDRGGTGSSAPASPAPAPADAAAGTPAIDFSTRLHDFGLVNEGTPLRYVFEVLNRGTAPLLLSGVATSCGCTAATAGATTIPPGGRSPLAVTMDTHGEHGKGTRTITVSSNDPRQPTATLTIAYDVEHLLFLDRAFVELKPPRGHPRVERVWLDGNLANQAHLRVAEVNGAGPVRVRVIGGAKKGVQLELRAARASSGDGSVTVATGVTAVPELTLPFRYQVN